MCCQGLAKTVQNGQRIAKGWAYLAGGVNQELSERRVKICNNCPHLRGGLVCSFCGCPVDAKTRLPEEQCADDKNRRWLSVSEETTTGIIDVPHETIEPIQIGNGVGFISTEQYAKTIEKFGPINPKDERMPLK